MNSSKLSLKEGFDFLFEEASEDESTTTDGQKLVIQGLTPENMTELMSPGGTADAVVNILAFDGIIRKAAGRKSTMALRGELFNKVIISVDNSKQKHINMIKDFVSNRAQAESLLEIYASSLAYLEDKGFNRFKALSESKQITTTTKGGDVLDTIMDKFSNQINFFKLKKLIFNKLTQIVPNLNDDISGKSAGAENLSKEHSKTLADLRQDLDKLVALEIKTAEELEATLIKFSAHVVSLSLIKTIYKGNENVQNEVADIESTLNDYKKQINDSAKNLKDNTEGDEPLLNTDELLANTDSDFENSFKGVEVNDSDRQDLENLQDDLDEFLTQASVSQEELPEDDSEDESGEGELVRDVKKKALEKYNNNKDLAALDEEEQWAILQTASLNVFSPEKVKLIHFNVLKKIWMNRVARGADADRLKKGWEKAKKEKPSLENKEIYEEIIKNEEYFKNMFNYARSKAEGMGSVGGNVAGDVNIEKTIEAISDLSGVRLDDKLSSDAEDKSEFEDMKTQIGSPSPEDEVFVQTTLSTPEDGGFNDFVRKYAAAVAFISHMSKTAGKELMSDSSQNLKAGQLVNLLKKHANLAKDAKKGGKLSDAGSIKALDASISNLAKFTHKNVEGILFERAGSSKYFVKINKLGFVNASNLIKQTMKNMSPEDAFSDAVLGTFFLPKFQLTDSAGNNLFTNIDGARLAFKNANTSKKSVELVKEKGVDSDLGKLIFKIENKPVMSMTSSLKLIITNPANLNSMSDAYIDFSDLGGITKSFKDELGLSNNQNKTVVDFILAVTTQDEKNILDVIDEEDVSDEAKQKIADVVKSTLLPQDTATQQLVSKKSDVKVKANVNTVNDLLNHEDIRTMMDRLYLDKSLTYAISAMNDTQILSIKNGGTDEKNKVQSMLIASLKPDMTAIKNEVRNLCNKGSENREIWDGIFNNKFNEEAFKGAYGTLIISAVDKIVRSKNARITEGFFSKALSFVKATIGNIATPLLLMKVIGFLGGAASIAAAAPYLTALAAGFAAKGLYDARKWAKEADQYRENPIKYIEGLLDDDKIKKSAQGIVNIAVSDIIIKAIDPTHKVAAQGREARKLRGGQSEFAAEMKTLTSHYDQLSDEQKSHAKELNDFILGQMGQTTYYNRGIVSDSIINMIFNKMLFGKERISDACRNELLSGTIDIERSEYRQALIQALIAAIKSSPVKNNFIDYIESHVRSNNRKGALTMGTEEEMKERGNTTWYGMRKSAYLSTEQINKKYLEELITDITGMSYEEYSLNENENEKINREFRESIQNRSLSSLLFEKDESRGSSELEDNIADMQDNEKKKQLTHDDEVTGAVAFSMITPWYLSAYNMIKMKEVSIGGAKIFKDIHAWKTTPGTSGGTPGLFGYKISASLPKLINTVYRSPQEAAALGKAGGDAMGPQFHLPNGKFVQTYYWNGKSAIGTKKALSMIIGKTGVNAKTVGHYSEVAKNAKYLKTLGLNVDLKTGVVTADPKLGCFEIPPGDPAFGANLKTMSTSLSGAVKAQMSNPYSFNAYNDAAHTFSDGTFSEKAVAKMSSHMLKNIMGKGLEGDLGDVTDLDPAFKNYIMKHVFSSIMSGTKMKIKMTSGSLADVKPSDLQVTAKSLQNGMQQVINDYKAAAVKLKVAAVKKGTIQAALDYFKDTSPEGEAFNKTMIKSMNDNIFNKTVAGSGVKVSDVIQNLNNDEAHAGLNLAMKKAIVGGGLSMTKAPSTAAVKTLLAKTRVVQALTGHGKLGGDPLKVEIPDGLDWKALGIKGALFSLIPIKIMTTFAQRGIQGGKFAEFFYKMFNPQQIFYTDMLRALTGSQINIPKAQAQVVDKDGGFSGPSVNIDEDITTPNEGTSPMSLGLRDIESLTGQQKASSKTESFVYKNSIVDFLFENKVVVKSNKNVSVVNEDFGLFKSEFKKLFK